MQPKEGQMHHPNPLSSAIAAFVLFAAFATATPVHAELFRRKSDTPLPSPPPQNQISQLPETVAFQQPVYSPPSYSLPYEGYRYQRKEGGSKVSFFSSGKPSEEMLELLKVIRARAEQISRFGLPYVFGGDHPSEGGLDCSGTMQYMLSDIGFKDIPRTSFDQYAWLKKNRTLQHAKSIPSQVGGRKGIKPGDLIFWGGTYNSDHKVSHVMIYLGQGNDGTHYMFGARGKSKKGLHGSGVDVFKLDAGFQKGLIGYGSLPGVS